MHKQIRVFLPQMLLTLTALIAYMPASYAQSSYGSTVNSTCLAFNGTQPYTGCTLCHTPSPSPKATRVEPQWTWWQNQLANDPATNLPYLYDFCPPQTNPLPDSVIKTPANNTIINIGTTVSFTGTSSYHGTKLPLVYAWNFGGAAANSTVQNPSIVLNTVGTFTVTFTVSDSSGLADPTPATMTLTVKDPNANQAPNGTITTPAGNVSIKVGESVSFAGTGIDPDNNTPITYAWTFGGGAANSTLQNPVEIFNTAGIYSVTLTVTDTVNGLPGLSDPTPDFRTVTVGTTASSSCTDKDGDNFNAEGGFCGPKDCDDDPDPDKSPKAATINPGAIEACNDKIDNDCNGDIDGKDKHCNGGECIAQLLNKIEITSASWEQDDRKLSVKGPWTTAGATIKLTDTLLGSVLGTTTSTKSGWSFELEHLAMAPCRVGVEITGRSGERDVAYAPSNCSGKPAATNNPPVANADSATTPQNVPVNIAVLSNDTDPDKDALSIVVFTQPGHGVVTLNGQNLVYTPTSGYSGTDSFTYTLSDGHGGTAKGTITITVLNKPPVANADTATTQQNAPVNITVLANDTDPENDTLSITGFTQPGHGVVTKNGLILVYTPASGYSGADSFAYTLSDGHGGSSTATVTITVKAALSNPIKVVIGSATWSSSDKKMLVSGSGGVKGASVKILNAATKATIETTKTEDNGTWKITKEKPSVVPCKVRVEITKDTQTGFAEKAVANAPKTCK